MVKIVQNGDPVLRDTASPVPVSSIKSAKIKKIISDMKKALGSQDDGVAIAAPQIGVPMRIFVVSHKVSEQEHSPEKRPFKDEVFINPVITACSGKREKMEEGCLSVKDIYGSTSRYGHAIVEAYNEQGKKITEEAYGLRAQIFQHETDHLNGILFTDHAKDLYTYEPEDSDEDVNKNSDEK